MNSKQTGIRIPIKLYEWVKREAAKTGRRTVTNQILYLIERAMNATDKK